MIVNRYTLIERGVSLKDITAIQRKAVKLIQDKCSYKTTKHENKICNVLYFETTELIEALKTYKVKLRSDCVEATDKVIKILEGLEMPKDLGKMKDDYMYCIDKDTCIHRRGCKRWIGNYTENEVHKFYTENRFVSEVDYKQCVPNYKDVECENNFQYLDRFRYSDGSSMK